MGFLGRALGLLAALLVCTYIGLVTLNAQAILIKSAEAQAGPQRLDTFPDLTIEQTTLVENFLYTIVDSKDTGWECLHLWDTFTRDGEIGDDPRHSPECLKHMDALTDLDAAIRSMNSAQMNMIHVQKYAYEAGQETQDRIRRDMWIYNGVTDSIQAYHNNWAMRERTRT